MNPGSGVKVVGQEGPLYTEDLELSGGGFSIPKVMVGPSQVADRDYCTLPCP